MSACALCGSALNPGDARLTVTGDSGQPSLICAGCTQSRPLVALVEFDIAALTGGQ